MAEASEPMRSQASRRPTPRRVLVTGGAGFLGTHLCERLIAAGHEVLCCDNFQTGTRANVEHLTGSSRFSLIEHDIRSPLELEADEIYNLACPASPRHYQADPVATTMTNVLGAANMLELARRNGARILQASTSEIYGDPEVHPQRENYFGHVNPFGPRACYDEGKRCAESLFHDFAIQHGVPVRVARIFNTYGPGMQGGDGRVVPNFILQALMDEPMVIYGDGNQTRSFCYRDDLVEGVIRLMDAEKELWHPVNLGNPKEITVRQLAEQVIALTGTRSRVVHVAGLVDDPRRRRPDITRARHSLGWSPDTALHDGLAQTIAWFDRQLAAA